MPQGLVAVLPLVGVSGFDALPSFDRINLASTLLQTAVIIAFAAAQTGAARHFARPAMGHVAIVWRLLACAAFVNIFSSVSGAVWNNRPLSRALTSVVVALVAAAIPFVRSAVRALISPELPLQSRARDAITWGAIVLVVHAAGVFGTAALFPDLRVVPVTVSRGLLFAAYVLPAWFAWQGFAHVRQNRAALELLAIGFAALAVRQGVAVLLGLRVGQPDLPFGWVVTAIVFDVIAVMIAGACTLLATTAEEVTLVNAQAQEIAHTQEQLAGAVRMESLGRMAAGVAHDVNNVFQVVEMTVEMARESGADSARPIDWTPVESSLRHGKSLTTQLLTFARARQSEPSRFDPVERLRGITALLSAMAGPLIEISVSASAEGSALVMDPAQFEQVVINLVANARDAVPPNGHIRVQLDRIDVVPQSERAKSLVPGRYVRLVVEDSGSGIPAEIHARIFEPFFTTKESGRGTGLGLATVHGIARQAMGVVTLESEPGHGTTFEVLLPAA